MSNQLKPFLADTLWFGMTSRLPFDKLKEYSEKRAKQGFNAVQVVIGIPPEVGPLNKNAFGAGGPAWDMEGNFNRNYLDDCEERVKLLNDKGLKVIIYGGWGHHINWLGVPKMKEWWEELILRFEKYEVIFCLCGESNLWIGETDNLLPDKTTQDFKSRNILRKLLGHFPFNRIRHTKIINKVIRIIKTSRNRLKDETLEDREKKWTHIADHVSRITKKPLLIHTVHTESSREAIHNPHVLSAVTTQTGHVEWSRKRHWQDPIKFLKGGPDTKFINLEPWYEGILTSFRVQDQLFSFWASMMAGAFAYCYGAHGIWNCGDGNFLAQWGKQTFEEALKLETPNLIGASHKFFTESEAANFPFVIVDENNNELISICRKNEKGDFIQFFTNYTSIPLNSTIEIFFDPLKGKIVDIPDASGPLVVKGKSLL